MSAWSLADPAVYRRLELYAHELLAEVPLHDLWCVDLPGGGPGRSIADLRGLMSFEQLSRINPIVRALFALRALLGRLFGWDEEGATPTPGAGSYLERVDAGERERSLVMPGSMDGPFVVLYCRENEMAGEARNATVHAFSVQVLVPRPDGYRAYWAIYVRPAGRLTSFYMALIQPFRRFLVYPAILRHVHRSWVANFAGAGVDHE